MADVVFTNVRILDGTGQLPYSGSVLVQGNRIRQVGRSTAPIAPGNAMVIDGAGATLMPGMCEAHTHFSWNDASSLAGIQTLPLEEHVLWCAKVAKRYLQAGFTSCVGAACDGHCSPALPTRTAGEPAQASPATTRGQRCRVRAPAANQAVRPESGSASSTSQSAETEPLPPSAPSIASTKLKGLPRPAMPEPRDTHQSVACSHT